LIVDERIIQQDTALILHTREQWLGFDHTRLLSKDGQGIECSTRSACHFEDIPSLSARLAYDMRSDPAGDCGGVCIRGDLGGKALRCDAAIRFCAFFTCRVQDDFVISCRTSGRAFNLSARGALILCHRITVMLPVIGQVE
jgi:hypothetical protein